MKTTPASCKITMIAAAGVHDVRKSQINMIVTVKTHAPRVHAKCARSRACVRRSHVHVRARPSLEVCRMHHVKAGGLQNLTQ